MTEEGVLMKKGKQVFGILLLLSLFMLAQYIYRLGISDKIESEKDVIASDAGRTDIIMTNKRYIKELMKRKPWKNN